MLNNIIAKKIIKWDIYNFKITSLLYVYVHYWILRKDRKLMIGEKKTVICHRKVFLLVIFTMYYAQMCFNPVVNILYLISSCF